MIIAIDGTAASGKGTLGRTLAMRLDLDYLDTGKLYRAVGHAALTSGVDIDASDPTAIAEIATNLDLSQPFTSELRTTDVGEAASKVATLAEVRQALLRKQREFAEHPPHGKGAVLDGRDIGTVVLPDADAKFYIDAAADIRANRRHLELVAAGEAIEFPEVLSDLIKRDCRDKNRTVAPLIAADDAFFVDTSTKNAEEVLELVLSCLQEAKLV
ncbi:MAG TPA: (d)CMP kinase [Alphaproteobacteria bacterium]|nr:(d)CMP kinase [Alphaproteobacteria bacterium]